MGQAGHGSATVKVGTSGFSYPEWRGAFYPEKLPQPQVLAFYSQHFPAVELNSTYYHIPPARNMAAMAYGLAGTAGFGRPSHSATPHQRIMYSA